MSENYVLRIEPVKLIVTAQHGLSVIVSESNAFWLPSAPLIFYVLAKISY